MSFLVGSPRYTIGLGCSDGSYQQHQTGDNYPGLVDGILPGLSFPEVLFGTVYSSTDMRAPGEGFARAALVNAFAANGAATQATPIRLVTCSFFCER